MTEMTMPAIQADAHERRDLFLSHRSVDKALARRLAADIEAESWNGRVLRVWLDEAAIPLGGSILGHKWGGRPKHAKAHGSVLDAMCWSGIIQAERRTLHWRQAA